MQQPKQPFLETLYHLRTLEQIILYNKVTTITAAEEKDTLDFLEAEYEREITDYPFTPPKFDAKAAVWGAKTLYFSSQLLLYREDNPGQLTTLIPNYLAVPDAGALLSADICLRFLPTVVKKLILIDSNDPLIDILKQRLLQFHYSAIGLNIDHKGIDLQQLFNNKCFEQLYLDRVMQNKAIDWLSIPLVKQGILKNMGNYKTLFWREASPDNHIK